MTFVFWDVPHPEISNFNGHHKIPGFIFVDFFYRPAVYFFHFFCGEGAYLLNYLWLFLFNSLKIIVFIYSPLAVLGLHCFAGFSLVAVSKGSSLVVVCRILTVVASEPPQSMDSVVVLQLLGYRAQAQQCSTKAMGLVVPWHVKSSQIRDRTHVSCIGRQILNHCITKEVQKHQF